ncbi:MAG: hypothetical protein JSS12_04985 [Verrucomicrobia bacterium]|nr:hypothetical protein [Verrucomicrobiota bacterium]
MPSWFDELLQTIAEVKLAEASMDKASIASSYVKPAELPAFSIEWVRRALELGNIEPSQPNYGKLVGWPQRSISRETLYVDFVAWREKFHPKTPLDHKSDFYKVCDWVFLRDGDRYQFPPIDECRKKLEGI